VVNTLTEWKACTVTTPQVKALKIKALIQYAKEWIARNNDVGRVEKKLKITQMLDIAQDRKYLMRLIPSNHTKVYQGVVKTLASNYSFQYESYWKEIIERHESGMWKKCMKLVNLTSAPMNDTDQEAFLVQDCKSQDEYWIDIPRE
jgi:hypothetical protein